MSCLMHGLSDLTERDAVTGLALGAILGVTSAVVEAVNAMVTRAANFMVINLLLS